MNKKYLQYFDAIKAILNRNIEAEARDIAYHGVVVDALADKFEGKTLTNKRVIDALTAVLPAGASVAFEGSGSFFLDNKIRIWNVPGHVGYADRLTFYVKQGDFSRAMFQERNGSTGFAASKRNNRRAVHLNAFGAVQKAASAIDNFNRAKAQLDAALALLEDDNSEIRRALVEGAEGKDRR
jgi:hypothetical protein